MRKSPLNYVGGKHKILNQLLPLFPQDIDCLAEPFAGGLSVSLNCPARRFWLNDTCPYTTNLYRFLRDVPDAIQFIDQTVQEYSLSKTNQTGFLRLREDFNRENTTPRFFALLAHSFNHQSRFNRHGEFNMPFGRNRSCFNPRMRQNLRDLVHFLKTNDVRITNLDFRRFDATEEIFLYCDPPYRLMTAVYNTGWAEQDDIDLAAFLDAFHEKKGKFALSCLLEYNSRENEVLKPWSQKYIVHPIVWKHNNSSYHKKNTPPAMEMCVTNY